MQLYKKIVSFLNKSGVNYELVSHPKVYTSDEAAKVREDMTLENGIKSLLIRTNNKEKKEFYLLVIPGNLKLNNSKVKKLLKVHSFSLANPEEVLAITSVEIGAVAPFSFLYTKNVTMYQDDDAFGNVDLVAFNPGVHDKTIMMNKDDFFNIIKDKYHSAKIT